MFGGDRFLVRNSGAARPSRSKGFRQPAFAPNFRAQRHASDQDGRSGLCIGAASQRNLGNHTRGVARTIPLVGQLLPAALRNRQRACYAHAMPAPILPLIEAAAHWPERGALIGLDLGTKTIGVAVSNADRRLATGIETIQRKIG